jgi:hypothetical protein
MTKRQEVASRGKGHLRMEELTEAINSSSHFRVFAIQWNMDKDKRESGKGKSTKVLLQSHENRNTESSAGMERQPVLLVAGVQQMERGIWQ